MSISKILTRDFNFAFFALFAYSSAYFVLIPTLPIYLSELKAGESEIGVLIGVFSVSSLIFRPFVGKALLRISERSFMLAGALLSALSSVALLGARPFWPFFWVRVFQGIGLAFFFTSSTALIANISQERYRGESLSYFFLSNNIAFAITPSFGMFLINRFRFTPLFLFCTAISLAALLLSLPLKRREDISRNSPLNDPSIGEEGLFSRKALPSSIMAFFTHMIWGSITAFFPLYAIEQGVTNPGFFFTIFAITLILCRTLGGKWLDRYSREKVLFPCLINYIAATFLLAFSKTISMFALAAVIWGAGTAFAYPALVALALDLCGPARGPAMGTFTAFADLGVGLGAVIMGLVLSVTNYRTMFLCLSLIGLINFLYFNSFVRKRNVTHE